MFRRGSLSTRFSDTLIPIGRRLLTTAAAHTSIVIVTVQANLKSGPATLSDGRKRLGGSSQPSLSSKPGGSETLDELGMNAIPPTNSMVLNRILVSHVPACRTPESAAIHRPVKHLSCSFPKAAV